MNVVYELAIKLAYEKKTMVSRIDIQFNYKSQSYSGRVWYVNGETYDIYENGAYIAIGEWLMQDSCKED